MASLLATLALSSCRPPVADTLSPTFTEVRRLGCRDCPGPEQFSRIMGLSVDRDGGLYVADYQAPFLRVWSADGRVVAFVGQEGHGPGELQFVSEIFPGPEGGFTAVDTRQRRWVFFDAEGEYTRSISVSGSITQSTYSAAEQALYAAVGATTATGERIPQIRRWTVDSGDEPVVVTTVEDAPPAAFGGRPAAIYNLAALPQGGVGFAYGFDQYLLTAFDGSGELRYRIEHDVERVPRTEEELLAERQRLGRFGRAADVDPLRAHFMGGALQFDDTGRAWISTERALGDETIFDVFSPRGEYLGEVTLLLRIKSPGQGFDIAGDFLATIHADETGTEFVTLWRMDGVAQTENSERQE